MTRSLGIAALLLIALVLVPRAVAQTYLVVVGGIGGEPRYSRAFDEWCTTLVAAAGERLGVPQGQIVYLAAAPAGPPATDTSTKANVESVLTALAGRAEADASVFIVLVGHGSAVGGASRFHLPGPDITAQNFAALLDGFPTQQVVFVALSSASGGFVQALSGERRTIITATRSGFERNETVFPEYFVEAFAATGADTDKDERVSVLEAFNYARREVRRSYESNGQLLTEHALLDDNGDREGSTEPDAQAGDGAVASQLFLLGTPRVAAATVPGDSALVPLYEERTRLERAVAELRTRKERMTSEAYERELERLLLALARVSRAIREREGGPR
jgi:hypothetical protein